MIKLALALALALVASSGCAAYSSAYQAKPAEDRDAFVRCQHVLLERQCGASVAQTNGSPAQLICLNALADSFAKAPDGKKWLIRSGCPRDMVD